MGELIAFWIGFLLGVVIGILLFESLVLEPLQVECEKNLPRFEECILAYIPEDHTK